MTTHDAPFAECIAPPAWRTVDLISDLHLHVDDQATFAAWRGYFETTPADAIFILGDLMEVWAGDDAAAEPGFEAQCCELLHNAARRRPIFVMHGNRDFLLGPGFAAGSGVTMMEDPTVLVLHDERWLLSHGDELCLDDTEYLRFRAQVRSPAWQQAVLAQPLEQRRALARSVRTQSDDRKRSPGMVWADVDAEAARDWLRRANARTLIHGHTHRPAVHDRGNGMRRVVLSDWDAAAQPPRAQVLCLSVAGAQRVDLR